MRESQQERTLVRHKKYQLGWDQYEKNIQKHFDKQGIAKYGSIETANKINKRKREIFVSP